ncbi:unnamed protein product [Zymoseptoria tritici ST99CH_3D7]|uniref:Uncharacterized protein n=1 Tax=Zymoseptoria tritici (strain ST99CH_3D7) TaxID=1276538 RepID=A0A1X7SA40_ZYMT9|nr:unnamed protein product [Zymoseptoria tritici ST99CH_3D7]
MISAESSDTPAHPEQSWIYLSTFPSFRRSYTASSSRLSAGRHFRTRFVSESFSYREGVLAPLASSARTVRPRRHHRHHE